MGVASLAKNALSTVTGSVAKAVIRFKDERHKKTDDPQMEEGAELKGAAVGGLGSVSSLAAYTPNIGDALMGAVTGAMGIKPGSEYNRSLVVQFNPASIRLQSHAGDDDVSKMNYKQDGSPGITNGEMDLHVDMSVDLIFDQISNMASFKSDIMDLSVYGKAMEGLGAAGTGALGKMLGQKNVSVQQIVEAFIAIMRNPNCRKMCFEWGDLKYEGLLRTCNTTYTMFDMMGNPVRAKVTLTIYLVETVGKVVNDYSNGYWYGAYIEAFIKGNPLAESMLEMLDWEAD